MDFALTVGVRVRGKIASEVKDEEGQELAFDIDGDRISESSAASDYVASKREGSRHAANHAFRFDGVFGNCCSTQELYDDIIMDLVAATCEGYNGTIFAYGQTASGKTHTMPVEMLPNTVVVD